MQPKYPIYVISKGRADCCLTAKFLLKDKVPFRLVIEPQEKSEYAKHFDESLLEILPFSNLGLGSIPARNWCWEHSISVGAERHWILDDNIRGVFRRYKARRYYCESGVAFRVLEDFVDRYDNVAIAGLNYSMFCPDGQKLKPFFLNAHVYSCILIRNSNNFRWRGRYNEDTDLCLQALASGDCTILFNVFTCLKLRTLTMKGGNMESLYQGDGRLRMARSLERIWPYVVSVDRRYGRPQHVIRGHWTKFDNALRLKPGVVISTEPNEYGLRLEYIGPKGKRSNS